MEIYWGGKAWFRRLRAPLPQHCDILYIIYSLFYYDTYGITDGGLTDYCWWKCSILWVDSPCCLPYPLAYCCYCYYWLIFGGRLLTWYLIDIGLDGLKTVVTLTPDRWTDWWWPHCGGVFHDHWEGLAVLTILALRQLCIILLWPQLTVVTDIVRLPLDFTISLTLTEPRCILLAHIYGIAPCTLASCYSDYLVQPPYTCGVG